MKTDKLSTHDIPVRRIIMRYLLFQIPGISILILVSLFFLYVVEVPGWTIWLLAGAWVIKELITVPFTWRLYIRPRLSPAELMLDQYGVAIEKLDPKGFIQFHNEIWEAEAADPHMIIEKGETVKIHDIREMRLIVEKVK